MQAPLLMPFINALEKLAPLSEECRVALRAVAKPKSYQKEYMLVSIGQISNTLYFVESGLLRIFYYPDTDPDTEEATSWFGQEGGFVSSIKSFLTQQPSAECVQVLEDSQLWAIQKADLDALFIAFPELNYHFRVIYEKYMVAYENRMQMLRTKDSVKRYALFLATYPKLANRLKIKHLARFLNLHPDTLSRIRSIPPTKA